MTETKFTPGPWRQVTGFGYCTIRRKEGVIADMRFVDGHFNPFDAYLIAAAPDLYAALHDLVASYEVLGAPLPINKEIEVAMDALAKARGES